MTGQEATLVTRLCEAGNPRELKDWERRTGHYVAACRVSAEDVPGLIDLVRRWGDPEWLEDTYGPQIDAEEPDLVAVTAWRALADLQAEAAVQPLVDLLCASDDEFDDWLAEELPHVFGKIGQSAIEPLTRIATDAAQQPFIRSIAACGLRHVAGYHAYTHERIVTGLTKMLADAVEADVEFNTALLVELVELQAVEAAEPIERAFANNLLDVGMLGDWEQVRRMLGVEGLGLKMPEHPHNSLEQFRRRMGIGIFSDRPIYSSGEIDDDAAQAYYVRAYDTFSKSREARQAVEHHGDQRWFQMLLEFGLNHLGETVDEMTLDSVQEFVLDYVPRKVSTTADAAEAIVFELALFWEYLDRVYQLPAAPSIVEWLKADDLVARLSAELSDSSNFGMAKSIYMSGKNAGFDMTSEAGIARFMKAYNESLNSNEPRASPMVPSQRVGRNEPCPCGSGKKFKKCCGGLR